MSRVDTNLAISDTKASYRELITMGCLQTGTSIDELTQRMISADFVNDEPYSTWDG
jgi:hypothetical protein